MFRHSPFILTLPALCVLGLVTLAAPAGAQITDPRVIQLEEQVRQLTGRVEELNFQMLQLQEQIRRQQEDNEFRLQQLEEQQGSAQPPAAAAPDTTDKSERVTPPPAGTGDTAVTGTPPRDLGSLTVDEQGNVVGPDVDFSQQGIDAAIGDDQTNAISTDADAETLYRTGYEHVLAGDYAEAELVFARFLERHPDDPLVADARFWLGESVLAQGRFEDAAEIFIDTRARYPQAGKAAETMLKIGTIMAALGDRDIACVTFADALAAHPQMSDNVRQRIEAERAKVRC